MSDAQARDEALRAELLAMAGEDQRVRAELAAEGTLFDGYHPRMAEVHRRHAHRLAAIMDRVGWPGRRLVGDDGAAAAWLVLQHAIGDPAVMRRGLALLQSAAPGDVDPAQVASWRREHKASIAATAEHWKLSTASVKRYCATAAVA